MSRFNQLLVMHHVNKLKTASQVYFLAEYISKTHRQTLSSNSIPSNDHQIAIFLILTNYPESCSKPIARSTLSLFRGFETPNQVKIEIPADDIISLNSVKSLPVVCVNGASVRYLEGH